MLPLVLPLLAALLASPSPAPGQEPAPPPLVNGLTWSHSTRAEFTVFDSFVFRAYLLNGGESTLRFAQVESARSLTVILTPPGAEPIRRALPAGAWLTSSRVHAVRPGSHALGFHGSLRSAFGPLKPGAYTLQIELGPAGYLTDVPGFEPRALVSQPFAFTVIAVSLEEARSQNQRVAAFEFELATHDGREVVVFTNHRASPVYFKAYGPVENGSPAHALVYMERWDGHAWDDGPYPYCGTGIERVAVPPGESRLLVRPGGPLPGGEFVGVLRLSMNVLEAGVMVRAVSAAFVVSAD